jgi:hypothetical protein
MRLPVQSNLVMFVRLEGCGCWRVGGGGVMREVGRVWWLEGWGGGCCTLCRRRWSTLQNGRNKRKGD